MKKIYITEHQERTLIKESMGVPNDAIEMAKDIVKEFLENINEMYEECQSLETEASADADEDDEWYDPNEWQDEFEYDFYVSSLKEYQIDVFMDSSSMKKADTDGSCSITINFAPIKRIIDKIEEQCADFNNHKWTDHDTNEVAQLSRNEIDDKIKREVYYYLYPIILHELTHDADEVGGNNDHIWLGRHHRYNEEDLREILYTFADQEMNARISSSYALMEDYLEQFTVPSSLRDKLLSPQEVNELVTDMMEEEDELRIYDMETKLSLIRRDIDDGFTDRNYITRAEKEKQQPYSLPYDLFRNDSRLKNNRKLKQLFHQNYNSAVKYVYNFYNKLMIRYQEKIMRTCMKAVQDYMEREDGEFAV